MGLPKINRSSPHGEIITSMVWNAKKEAPPVHTCQIQRLYTSMMHQDPLQAHTRIHANKHAVALQTFRFGLHDIFTKALCMFLICRQTGSQSLEGITIQWPLIKMIARIPMTL